MAVGEFHDEYLRHLNGRITTELTQDGFNGNQDWGKVLGVVKSIAICRSLKNISSEEAEIIYKRILELYPQFEERLKRELEEH